MIEGRFKRSEKLIKELAEIIIYILISYEKDNDFLSAKNCHNSKVDYIFFHYKFHFYQFILKIICYPNPNIHHHFPH